MYNGIRVHSAGGVALTGLGGNVGNAPSGRDRGAAKWPSNGRDNEYYKGNI